MPSLVYGWNRLSTCRFFLCRYRLNSSLLSPVSFFRKIFTNICWKIDVFSIKLSLAIKNAKIRLFRLFWVKVLIIKCLCCFLIKNARFGACFWPRYIATEALLHSNGATFGLQRSLRCTPKRPKTESKSATIERKQTLNGAKTAFFSVSVDDNFWRKMTRFFSNGGTFGILSCEFWVLNWDFWDTKIIENE